MKKRTTPATTSEADVPTPAPAKKAARKTAAKKAAAPATPEPEPTAPVKPARKTVAKKAAPAVEAIPPAEPAPVKKPAAKKAALKQQELLVIPETPAPIAAPVSSSPSPSADDTTPAPAKPRAARKTAAKRAAVISGESEAASPAPQNPQTDSPAPPRDPNTEPPAAYRPREDGPPQNQDHGPVNGAAPENQDWRPGSPDNAPPAYRQPAYPPRQQRPYPPRDPAAGPPPHPNGQAPPSAPYPPQHPNETTGPDGEPRRLTKWERWKLRKEKFKQQKQQRYLERTGRAPQPGGPNPNGPPGEGEPQERREFPDRREPRHDQPRPDPRGEPRQWEPRPPRPEIPLGPPEDCSGLLEMTDKGFAFLRPKERGFVPSPSDPFVSAELVRQHGLREGVWVDGIMQRGGRGPQVMELKKVNGLEPSAYRTLPLFEELTAINPNKRYILETEAKRHTTRLIDFISPIGRGQRGLIVAPPRAGKTTFLQHIAEAVLHNYEDVKVIVLLVDERPEEVTEIARALPGAEIMASSNDQDPRNHIRMAHLAVERAKRLVEAGNHVFMLLDSITRLARGFNNAMRGGGGGKAMSGGLDSRALEAPRRLFAAARNTREAGSLTIMATALVETNNKGDDLIFQEFKGTGNMELVLDRKISQAYVYPAVDIFKSGTRREELLLPAHQLEKVHLIRRGLSGHRPQEAVERLLQVMGKYNNNNQMLIEIKARGE